MQNSIKITFSMKKKKKEKWGIPVVAQQKQIQLVSMSM